MVAVGGVDSTLVVKHQVTELLRPLLMVAEGAEDMEELEGPPFPTEEKEETGGPYLRMEQRALTA